MSFCFSPLYEDMLTKFDICANQNCVIFDKSLGLNEPRVSNELQKRIDSERSEDNRKTRPRGSVCGAGSGIRTHGGLRHGIAHPRAKPAHMRILSVARVAKRRQQHASMVRDPPI